MRITTEIPRYTRFYLEQAVISYIVMGMGDDMPKVGSGKRTKLHELSKKACREFMPKQKCKQAVRTCRRLFMHFIKYGETPTETKSGRRLLKNASMGTSVHRYFEVRRGSRTVTLSRWDSSKDTIHSWERWSDSVMWIQLRNQVGYWIFP